MKFVLVNDSIPSGSSTCARCSAAIGASYLRDLASKKPYCDYHCYLWQKTLFMVLRSGHQSAVRPPVWGRSGATIFNLLLMRRGLYEHDMPRHGGSIHVLFALSQGRGRSD
jgi:hypothetical protein